MRTLLLMKKYFLAGGILVVVCIAFFALQFVFFSDKEQGAIQVTAKPKSAVYLNGKLIGQTPLCKCSSENLIAAGDYTIRLIPLVLDQNSGGENLAPFEQSIKINKSVLTVVDRSFEKDISTSEGNVITLSTLPNKDQTELSVLSFPDSAHVLLDGSEIGTTPLTLSRIPVSDHELLVKKDGYKDRKVTIRTAEGYKLEAIVFLGVSDQNNTQATLSAVMSLTPSVSTPSAKIKILDTPTGYLNVRSSNSISSSKIGVAMPGETYEVLDKKDNWFEIQLNSGDKGWVVADYVKEE